MSELSPYVHSCAEYPNLARPACGWAEQREAVDVLVCDEGTIWLFNPLSERAKAWVAEHVPVESWQWLCDSLAVEHRYAPALVEAMLGDGLIFAVSVSAVCRKLEKLTRLLQAADRIRERGATPCR